MSAAKKQPPKKSAAKKPAKKTAAKKSVAKKSKKSTNKPAAKTAAKKTAAKKTAAKKPATKKAKPATTMRVESPPPHDTLAASSPATTGTAGKPLTPIEAEARKLMDADAAGDIDNVFDIVEELEAIRKGLPKTSELYPEWKRFYDDCCRIMGESVGM